MMKNKFYEEILALYSNGSSSDLLIKHLGKGRAKKGMFEGDLEQGELEIGQVSSQINEIKSVSEIIKDIIQDFNKVLSEISSCKL